MSRSEKFVDPRSSFLWSLARAVCAQCKACSSSGTRHALTWTGALGVPLSACSNGMPGARKRLASEKAAPFSGVDGVGFRRRCHSRTSKTSLKSNTVGPVFGMRKRFRMSPATKKVLSVQEATAVPGAAPPTSVVVRPSSNLDQSRCTRTFGAKKSAPQRASCELHTCGVCELRTCGVYDGRTARCNFTATSCALFPVIDGR